MIQAFIFDLDGVITDTAEYHYQAWKALANEMGWKFDREVNEDLRGVSRIDSIRLILDHNDLKLDEDELNRLAGKKNEMYVESLKNITPEDYLPGARRLLTTLKEKGFKVGLGSASKNAPTVLEKLQASDYFNAIGDGTSVKRSKPAPDLFLYVAEKLDCKPQNCIVYEDAESGIDAAIAGGFMSVGIGPEDRVGHADIRFPDMASATFEAVIKFFEKKPPDNFV